MLYWLVMLALFEAVLATNRHPTPFVASNNPSMKVQQAQQLEDELDHRRLEEPNVRCLIWRNTQG